MLFLFIFVLFASQTEIAIDRDPVVRPDPAPGSSPPEDHNETVTYCLATDESTQHPIFNVTIADNWVSIAPAWTPELQSQVDDLNRNGEVERLVNQRFNRLRSLEYAMRPLAAEISGHCHLFANYTIQTDNFANLSRWQYALSSNLLVNNIGEYMSRIRQILPQ